MLIPTQSGMEDPQGAEQTENSSGSVAQPDFSELPEGAVHLIFSFLGPRELCAASAVCKSWRDLNRDASANRVGERTSPSVVWSRQQYISSVDWQNDLATCSPKSTRSFLGCQRTPVKADELAV